MLVRMQAPSARSPIRMLVTAATDDGWLPLEGALPARRYGELHDA
jgi:hypothetical protein